MDEPIDLDEQPKSNRGNPQNLVPFDSDRAKLAAAKSAEVRRAKKAVSHAENLEHTKTLAVLRSTYSREDLGPSAAALAQDVLRRTATGEIGPQHWDKAARFIEALTGVARLEAGQATSQTAHLAISSEQALEQIRQAQQDRG